MDLLRLLKDKTDSLSSSVESQGMLSVVSHIEIAEKHYSRGLSGDEYLFNDVIYRCNQAFEGVLKEAYRIIKGTNPSNIAPYKIEKYFEDKNVLKERVLKLFTNYRKEWRNKSTHDYELYFSEQEAFLAIVNISAFINILLDQIIEKIAYDKEALFLAKNAPEKISKINEIDLLFDVGKVLKAYSLSAKLTKNEPELIGSLSAYFKFVLPNDIKVTQEAIIHSSGSRARFHADFLLQKNKQKIIIEVKTFRGNVGNIERGNEQLLTYMSASGVTQGILYIAPTEEEQLMDDMFIETHVGDTKFQIIRIVPTAAKKS